MKALVAYTKYGQDPFIRVAEFNNVPAMLDFLINDLDLLSSDSEYIPDSDYKQDLQDLVSYLEENFVGDGSYWATMLTIMVDGEYVFRG